MKQKNSPLSNPRPVEKQFCFINQLRGCPDNQPNQNIQREIDFYSYYGHLFFARKFGEASGILYVA